MNMYTLLVRIDYPEGRTTATLSCGCRFPLNGGIERYTVGQRITCITCPAPAYGALEGIYTDGDVSRPVYYVHDNATGSLTECASMAEARTRAANLNHSPRTRTVLSFYGLTAILSLRDAETGKQLIGVRSYLNDAILPSERNHWAMRPVTPLRTFCRSWGGAPSSRTARGER